jgi:hypothetical protein
MQSGYADYAVRLFRLEEMILDTEVIQVIDF